MSSTVIRLVSVRLKCVARFKEVKISRIYGPGESWSHGIISILNRFEKLTEKLKMFPTHNSWPFSSGQKPLRNIREILKEVGKEEENERETDKQTQKKTIKRKRIKTSHYNWYEMIWNDNGRVWAVCSGVGFPVWNSVWNFDSSSFFFDWLVGWLVLSFFLSCFWCYLSTSQTWNRHFISVTFCLVGNHLVARTRFGPAAQWKASSDNIHLNCWIVEPIQWMYDNIKTLSDRIDGNLESCDGCYTPLHTDTPKCVHSSHQRNK